MQSVLWSAKPSIRCGYNNFLLYQTPLFSSSNSSGPEEVNFQYISVELMFSPYSRIPFFWFQIVYALQKDVSTLETISRVPLANTLWAWGEVFMAASSSLKFGSISQMHLALARNRAVTEDNLKEYIIIPSAPGNGQCVLPNWTLPCVEMQATDGCIAICGACTLLEVWECRPWVWKQN